MAHLLDRSQWLQMHGFIRDPFPATALQAETDPAFELNGLPTFVDPPNYDLLRGQPDDPGYRFIFAISGGGKTSLRRRIKREFDERLQLAIHDASRVLAIEYIDHSYQKEESDAQSHIVRIVKLVVRALKKLFGYDFLDSSDALPPRELLESAVNACRANGIEAICVLVDDIDKSYHLEAFQKIAPLAKRIDLLNLNGVMFKFILPAESLNLARQVLPLETSPPYTLTWNQDKLKEVLHQRVGTCIDDTLRYVEDHALALLCDHILAPSIEEELIGFSVQAGHPRAMLQLGYYLLEEHFDQSPNGRRDSTELVGREALLGAYDKIIDTTPPDTHKIFKV